MKSFKDKTVLITGGSSGIGFGFARLLVRDGARVAIIGTNEDKLDRAVSELCAAGGQAMKVRLDVADGAAWPAAAQAVEDAFGPVQGLFLNAGIGPPLAPVELTPVQTWVWSWEVNLMGLVHGLRAVLPGMKARGEEGHILITGSIASVAMPPMMGAYSVAKAAALALAETLRSELRDSPLGVSVLCPAAVNTDLPATSARHTPPHAEGGDYETMAKMLSAGLDPLDVARFSLEKIAAGEFYIFTHPQFQAMLAPRYAEMVAAMAGSAGAVN